MQEPLVNYTSDINKYVVYPVPNEYKLIYNAYLQHNAAVWFQTEIDLSEDVREWKTLNDDLKFYIKRILAFFATSDGIVLENLCSRFLGEFEIPWVQMFYRSQAHIEDIHAIVYGMLLDEYVSDKKEKRFLLNAIEEIPSIKQKGEWAIKWINSDAPLAERIVAFACVEGIFFYGSFASIFLLREKGILPGLCKANDFIVHDEGMHRDFAVLLHCNYIVNKLSTKKIHEIIGTAVDIEINFICESIPCTLIGMKKNEMAEYIRFVANDLARDLGYPILYENTRCPFPFMERQNFEIKTNFFERSVSDYQKVFEKDPVKDDLSTLSFDELDPSHGQSFK